MGPAMPHTVRLILEIVPSLPDTPSASDEHQCISVVQGGALRLLILPREIMLLLKKTS